MPALTAYQKFLQVALKYGFSLWGIPKTRQTISYVSDDDGNSERGYPRTGIRFVDNGDGTITDNATGLMWIQDTTGPGCNNGEGKLWAAAVAWAAALTFAGYSDWRLPNINELASIGDYGRSNPSIDPIFTNATTNAFWSSTTKNDDTLRAYYLQFTSNLLSNFTKTGKNWRMRPVRLNIPR